MAYDPTTTVTDDVDDNLAEYHNEIITALEHVMSAAAYASYTRTQSMTGNVTLTDADLPIQSLSPTAARNLTLPAVATTNHPFFVYNRSGTYDITVKNAGATTIGTVTAGTAGLFFSDGTNGWVAISGGGGGGVESVVAGTNITVDNTDPANPVVSASGGGGTLPRLAKTADYTITSGDVSKILVLTSSATADKTFTLPAASALTDGQYFVIKNESDYTLSWSRAGSDTVDGATSGKLPKNWAIMLASNGSNGFTVVTKHKPPIVATVNRTTNQSAANATEVFISWDAAIIANTSIWASSPNPTRLTVPPGATKVRLVMQCAWAGGYAVGLRLIYAYKNGSGFDGIPIFTTPATSISSFYSMAVSDVLPVTPGDYFEIVGYHNAGATIDIVSGTATIAMLEVVD